ncbi:hypothetical protein [Fusibacter ferrireducens]|uniref:Uncharacterized protein n=1 Tax=Fusibacter ferrireducens TaxID=2785058 RepID=A0ABR9ZN93_9FIRM|nr:hypothetical protein [Fusibacter ferrireducens]MBF4691937.1 hypothetical protein [Fusibacter ferrireducens]
MDHKIYELGRKYKQLSFFMLIYLVFIFVTGFVMGISFGNNDIWEKGIKRAKNSKS